MAKESAFIVSLVFAGSCAAACQQIVSADRFIPAGFWFEGLTPAAIAVVNHRLSAPLTSDDFRSIESVARRELHLAFENTRLQFTDARESMYRVRVVPQLANRRSFPAAGESRSFGGIRGDGIVNFNIVAISALAYAADGTDRETLVQAIGRGVGRTAVHEFAHQILGPSEMDGTTDRLSYEHGDLRAEHFYAGLLHWGPAGARLRERVGLAR